MDTLLRAKASRRGNRAFVTKLLTKAQGITQAEGATPQSISDVDRGTIDLVLTQLDTKKRQLEELDESILAAITSEGDLEEETLDVQMYQFDLTEQVEALKKFSSANFAKKDTPSSSAQQQQVESHHHREETKQATPPVEQTVGSPEQQETVKSKHPVTDRHLNPDTLEPVSVDVPVVPHTHVVRNVGQFVTRLPKLTLPTFSGDPLQFQTFWDSFEAAIHNNEGLTGVQKLHYLRAQLTGDAAHVIENFPLTDSNYLDSVALLKGRFGQAYKLVNAHMDALMNLPKPVNSLSSLQAFHDKLGSHMRALSSLGKSPDTYSAMLTPMVLGKLPTELKKQLARDHNSGEWTIQELLTCILREIRVLEVGQYSNGFSKEYHTTTSSFHTGAGKAVVQRQKREVVCTYCKGSHTANQCTVSKITSNGCL